VLERYLRYTPKLTNIAEVKGCFLRHGMICGKSSLILRQS